MADEVAQLTQQNHVILRIRLGIEILAAAIFAISCQ